MVQPQFQKAVLSTRLSEDADMGPKDHILVPEACSFLRAARDTTVKGRTRPSRPTGRQTGAVIVGHAFSLGPTGHIQACREVCLLILSHLARVCLCLWP